MSDLSELDDKLEKHASRVKEIGDEIRSVVEQNDTESKARLDELATEQKRITSEVAPLLSEKKDAELRQSVADTQKQLEALMAGTRTSAKAIGSGFRPDKDAGYVAGSFLNAVASLNPTSPGWSIEGATAAKATLEAISHQEDSWGKATLGATDATGGWIVPNAIVDELIKPATYRNPYANLVTNVNGVTAPAVDIPLRLASPLRAVIAPFGSTKENVDLVYNGYTATMYTVARVHDIGNQFLRQSQGAAEADVMQELATAFALGESWYTINGTGTAMPYGLLTALTNAPATFTSSFTAAATLAGSVLTAIATASGALASRDRAPSAAVMSAANVWTMVAQGTDTAGFFFAGTGGAPAIPNVANGTLVSPFGVPVIGDSQFAADDLIVGDFKALKVYHGQSYRVDSSSVAGTRWDANVTGFRGEMELGLDARPAVFAGAFQIIADINV